jgi:hypothetical protein
MDTRTQVEALLREGGAQLAEGNRREAHRIWRQAAALNPKDKRIWQALLEVVENNDDRRVCLQNIVNLDPSDAQAVRRLVNLGGTLPPGVQVARSPLQKVAPYLIIGGVVLIIVIILLIIFL